YAYGDVEGMDPLSWYGQTGEVTQQLADADGDGRVDLVIHDGVQTVFHRNVGDGFGALAYPTYVVDQDTLGTTDGTAVQGAPDHELDPFTMHAYTTATAGAGDYDGDQRLDFYDGTELRFGDRDWPFLLIEIDNGRGLTSELAYTSSGDTNGRVPLHHGGALAFGAEPTFGNRVVVSSVTTEDAVTGQRARHLYKYWRGEQHRDVFLGFGEVTETLELADDPWSSWVEQWTQGTTYALDAPELGPQPTESREWVDVNHCFAPGLASPTCTPSFEIASETFTTGSWHGEHGERWLPDVVVRHDFGDEVGLGAARVSTQSVIYDGFGRPTSISSVQPSGQTQVVDVTWAESSDGDLVAPATIAIGDGVDVLRQTSIEYDDLPAGELSHGFRTRTVRCDESPTVTACANALEWQYTADSRGQPSTTVAPTGSTTTQTWGYNGAVLEHLDNALAQRTTHLINLRGQVTGTIGIDGVGHGNTFDTLGRRTEDTIAARTTGAPWIPIRRVHFHDDSVPWFEHIEDLDDSGAVIGEVYNDKDGTGRTTRTWHAKADHTGWFRQDRLHDLAGRLVRASYTTGTALDHDADLPLDFTLTQDRNYYDGYGRLREHYDDEANGIGGRTITFPDSVSNWVERETDAEGHVTRRVRDGRGNLLSVYQAGPSGVESLRAEYGYDALDRLTSIVQPNGNTFTYHYDSLDRILRVAKGAVGSPPQDWMTYQYTGGRLTERTNNVGGFVRWLDHDALDRFTRYEVSDPVAPGGVLTYQLEYDTVVPGQLSGVLDPLGGELREYDDYARLQHHRRLFTQAPARDLLLSVERDIHGRPTQTRLPHDGAGAARITLDHVYQNGFETAVTIDHPSDPLLGSYDMLRGQSAADPRLHSVTVPQVELDVRWDRSLSPVMVDHHSFELNGVVRHDRNLDYAQNGWLLSNEHDRGHTNARFFEYDYDDLGRLETAWVDGAVASAFTFDSTGDLQSAHRQLPAPGVYTLAYPAAGTAVANQGLRHPISASGPGADEVFTRDAAGLLTAWEEVGGDVRQFEYDGLHRLRRVTLNGTTARIHTYGHDGTRLQTLQWDGGLRRDLHFGAWSETWNGSSYGRRVRVSSVLTVDITDPFDHERRWHMVELQGDASATYPDFPVSRASAIGNRTLSASGEELDGVGAPDLDATFHGAGRPAVEWTRAPVVAMGARHVAMGTLEWLAPEPLLFEGPQPLLGDPAGLDPFRYAGGNPVVYRDPTGYARQPQQIPFRGGGGSMSELAVEEELQQAGDILDFLEDFESKAADIAEARADLQAELRETWSPSRRRAIVSELADLDAVRTDYRRALRALPDMYEDVQGLAKMLDWDRAPAVLRGGLFSIMGRMGMAGAALMLGRDSFGAEVQQQWTSFEQEHSGAFTAGAMFGVLPGGQVLGAGITAASIAGAGGTFSTVNPPFLPSEGQVNPATGAPSTPRPHASSNPFGGGWVHD
ncbi:MAG: hypothetical protein K0V04_03905, partial [Deltaproteobacteria bacterium]|nr:hypothetical protein [Deltaproteobacteria bacterium]